jgi:transcriptional regulator with XRE-family HTH domain
MTTERDITVDDSPDAYEYLLARRGGRRQTLGEFLEAIRRGEEQTQVAFASLLGISRSHLCDIEKGRKAVSPERAARYAELLGYSPKSFVRMALQDLVDRAELDLEVSVSAA